MSTGTRSSSCIALDPAAKVEIPSDVEGRTGAAIDGGESLDGVAPLSDLRVLIPPAELFIVALPFVER